MYLDVLCLTDYRNFCVMYQVVFSSHHVTPNSWQQMTLKMSPPGSSTFRSEPHVPVCGVCMGVCMYACVCSVCTCVSVCIHGCVHVYMCVWCVYMCECAYMGVCMYACACVWCVYTNVCMDVCVCACMHVWVGVHQCFKCTGDGALVGLSTRCGGGMCWHCKECDIRHRRSKVDSHGKRVMYIYNYFK